jgi:hypothetical protein
MNPAKALPIKAFAAIRPTSRHVESTEMKKTEGSLLDPRHSIEPVNE